MVNVPYVDRFYHTKTDPYEERMLCYRFLTKTLSMGKAGQALKQVLETYGITQYKLAAAMQISRSNIHRWINEVVDPTGDSILAIQDALEQIDPEAAKEFIRLYLDRSDTQ